VIVGDQVVIGSNTALCEMGIKQAAGNADGGSLLDTEGFKKIAAGLPENLLSFNYTDSAVMFNQMMMQLQQVWPMAMMAATHAHIKLPVMLPSLGHIAKDMQPSCEYNYATPEGFRAVYRGTGLEVSLRGVAGAALGAGIAMPALARARSQARRAVDMSRLKQIGIAMRMYADDHDDQFPPDLEALKPYLGDDRALESSRKPGDFEGPSYIYIAGQNLGMYPGNIVVYENTGYCSDGVNVLFLDGHVEFMKPDNFRREFKETYERLGREMPDIQFSN
jgi:prepilin-type processing-associated H-X9-DG protein